MENNLVQSFGKAGKATADNQGGIWKETGKEKRFDLPGWSGSWRAVVMHRRGWLVTEVVFLSRKGGGSPRMWIAWITLGGSEWGQRHLGPQRQKPGMRLIRLVAGAGQGAA